MTRMNGLLLGEDFRSHLDKQMKIVKNPLEQLRELGLEIVVMLQMLYFSH